ncbi:MAG: hypothetical protein LBJ41_09990 [Treponema sp.]|nr:hypothetical protein [Treponema sp.]
MTSEAYDALDELLTKTTSKVVPNRLRPSSGRAVRMIAVDSLSEDYLFTKAIAGHKTPTEIIDELVRKELAETR